MPLEVGLELPEVVLRYMDISFHFEKENNC